MVVTILADLRREDQGPLRELQGQERCRANTFAGMSSLVPERQDLQSESEAGGHEAVAMVAASGG